MTTGSPSLMKGLPVQTIVDNTSLSLYIAVFPSARTLSKHNGSITFSNPADDSVAKARNLSSTAFHCEYRTVDSLSDKLSQCTSPVDVEVAALAMRDTTLLQCDMLNRSYTVDYVFSNGRQIVRPRSENIEASLPLTGQLHFEDISANCTSFQPSSPKYGPCETDITALRLVSYQAVMKAFAEQITGSIETTGQFPDVFNSWKPVKMSTSVLRTTLRETRELSFLRELGSERSIWPSLTAKFAFGKGQEDLGTRGPLGPTLEALFRNLRLSLTMEPFFQ